MSRSGGRPGAIEFHNSDCPAVNGAHRSQCTCDYLPPAPDVPRITTKDTNPKDAVGIRKAPLSTVSAGVMLELGTAMMEGAVKYGRHNYRVAGVRGSVYYDAAMRHLMAWWEGEDIDPDSGLSHIAKGIATLVVLRDAMMNDMWTDDRPPRMPDGWLAELNVRAGDILDKYPEVKDAFTEKARTK